MGLKPIPGKPHHVGTEEDVLSDIRRILTEVDDDDPRFAGPAQANVIVPFASPVRQAADANGSFPDLATQEEMYTMTDADTKASPTSTIAAILRNSYFLIGTVLGFVACAWFYAV